MTAELAARALLRRLFDAAVARAQPAVCLPPFLNRLTERGKAGRGRTIVVGAGKAAAAMARAVEDHWRAVVPTSESTTSGLEGLVVTRYGHQVSTTTIEVVQAGHPLPDQQGEAAAQRILRVVRDLGADDQVLCLISGGGSALLTLPAPGVSLQDKQAVSRALLACGAPISEINCVRKHLSAIKGGRLAVACHPARLLTLAISDVPGDDPAVIASGPTVADETTFAQARTILSRYQVAVPGSVLTHLNAESDETPKPNDPRLARAETVVVATPQQSLEAAAEVARQAGVQPLILGDSLEGEAREVARMHAGIARQVVRHGQPLPTPCVLLSGGETTVTVRGAGRGGRNTEFLLALAIALRGTAGVYALAGDTDGIDGTEDNAGAIITPETLARAAGHHLDAGASLARNDGYGFFAALGDLVVSGPTHTNVNDFRALLILDPRTA